MKLSTLITLAISATSSAFVLPKNLPDGIYAANTEDNTVLKIRNLPDAKVKFQRRDDIDTSPLPGDVETGCTGATIPGEDFEDAKHALFDYGAEHNM
jgi:hypothetical protein